MGHLSTPVREFEKNPPIASMFFVLTVGRMDEWTDGRMSLENLISAAMKQAAPHTSFLSSSYRVICVRR